MLRNLFKQFCKFDIWSDLEDISKISYKILEVTDVNSHLIIGLMQLEWITNHSIGMIYVTHVQILSMYPILIEEQQQKHSLGWDQWTIKKCK